MPMKKTFEKITAVQQMDVDSMTADDAMDTIGRDLRGSIIKQYEQRKSNHELYG